MRGPHRVALAAALTASVLVGGCVPASPDHDTYQDAAGQTLETAVSEVTTVATLLRLLERDKLPRPAAVAQLRYSQQGLDQSSGWFTGLTPPPGADGLADQVGTALDDAADLISLSRTAVHRNQPGQYLRLAERLDSLGNTLERQEDALP